MSRDRSLHLLQNIPSRSLIKLVKICHRSVQQVDSFFLGWRYFHVVKVLVIADTLDHSELGVVDIARVDSLVNVLVVVSLVLLVNLSRDLLEVYHH